MRWQKRVFALDDPRIYQERIFLKGMDCRVKPGNDGDVSLKPALADQHRVARAE